MCALIRVKFGDPPPQKNWFFEKSELSEMARTLIENPIFILLLFFESDVDIDDDDVDDGVDDVVGCLRGGGI
jgi:hypothetical protein